MFDQERAREALRKWQEEWDNNTWHEYHLAGYLEANFPKLRKSDVYELLAAAYFDDDAPDAAVKHNVKIVGKHSGVKRQIDVALWRPRRGVKMLTAIECRDHDKSLDVTHVDGLIGKMRDVGAKKAILLSPVGFSEAVPAYAKASGIETFRLSWFEAIRRFWWHQHADLLCFSCSATYPLIRWDVESRFGLFMRGECSSCGVAYVACQLCGAITGLDWGVDRDKGIICSNLRCGRVYILGRPRRGEGDVIRSYDAACRAILLEAHTNQPKVRTDKLRCVEATISTAPIIHEYSAVSFLIEDGLLEHCDEESSDWLQLTDDGLELVEEYLLEPEISSVTGFLLNGTYVC